MKKADKERETIIKEYKIAYSKLLEIPKFSDTEVKEAKLKINNDLINLIHCCTTFYCYDETVQIAEETGDKIIKCNKQCERCKQ